MRLVFCMIALTAALSANAAAKDYPVNEQPMYGNVVKNQAMLDADQQFVAAVLSKGYTRAQGSDISVKRGWDYLRQKDYATAMMRFNQAWLLDPDNGDAFHGFAVTVMDRDNDVAGADALFKTGEAKPRQSPGIWLDYGRFLLLQKRFPEGIVQLRKALTFPDMGPDAEALLTGALYTSGDVENACREAAKVSDRAQAPYLKAVELVRQDCAKRSAATP